jgi:hypothetical protein
MAVALPFIALAASAGGSVLSGLSQANAAGYQAQIARNNAQIARQNAAYSAQAGSAQITAAGEKARQQQGNVRAAIAANGIDVSSGSAADVQVSQREIGALDVANVAQRAANTVYGYQTQATDYQAQANLDQSEVAPDIFGGVLKGIGSLAGGIPSLPNAFSWMGGNSTNASGGDFGSPVSADENTDALEPTG